MTRAFVLLMAVVVLADALAAPVPAPNLPLVEPVRHSSYRERLPGTKFELDMVAIPGGEFLIGSPDGEKGRRPDEGPRRRVKVRPLWVSRVEVTWDIYDVFRKVEPRLKEPEDADAITRPSPPYSDETRGYGRDGYPAIGMSHHAAMEFCRWLSRVTRKAYRLPLESEWEWACRAGSRTAYHFGDDPAKLGEFAWYIANSGEATHPVGKKKPNPWGLHDMHGNVAEWCLDHYARDAYASARLRLPTANRYPHVARGGSFEDPAARCRSASRRDSDASWNKVDPASPQSIWWVWNADFVGFRVVRAVEEYPELKNLRSQVTKGSK